MVVGLFYGMLCGVLWVCFVVAVGLLMVLCWWWLWVDLCCAVLEEEGRVMVFVGCG